MSKNLVVQMIGSVSKNTFIEEGSIISKEMVSNIVDIISCTLSNYVGTVNMYFYDSVSNTNKKLLGFTYKQKERINTSPSSNGVAIIYLENGNETCVYYKHSDSYNAFEVPSDFKKTIMSTYEKTVSLNKILNLISGLNKDTFTIVVLPDKEMGIELEKVKDDSIFILYSI